jgi:hypothetical protein
LLVDEFLKQAPCGARVDLHRGCELGCRTGAEREQLDRAQRPLGRVAHLRDPLT